MFARLDAESYDRQYTDADLGRRILSYLSQYKRNVYIIIVSFVLLSLSAALRPVFISMGIDEFAKDSTNKLNLLIGALALTAVIEYGANWVRRRLLAHVMGNVVATMRKDAFSAAVHRDLAFYDTNKTGKIVSRITSDTQDFGDIMVLINDVIAQMLSVVVLVAILFDRSVQLTLLLIVAMPLVAIAATIFRNLARKATRQGSRAMAVVNDNIQESVSGISVAKNFRQEAMIYQEFDEVNQQSYQINMQKGVVLASVFPVLTLIVGVTIAVMLYVGAQFVVRDAITVGAWYLFIQGVDRFFFPIMNLSSIWSQLQQGLSATERILALVDAENDIVQTDDREAKDVRGHIQFENVTFEYIDDQPILKDFDLEIQPGESIAFVGHTGAGKSTIAKIITRFYEFQKGKICIDGHDIRSFNLQSYRRNLGIVPQQPFLFSGTIMENIRYGQPNATDAEIDELAHSIGNGEWLETLTDGLHTDVGERGARLSMGQRQLVSLLRVLIQKPAIFILDEATASIDPFTEMQIQEALDMILARSTSILIAHRLSTVRSADRIIVLREGSIIEEGSHEQLIEQDGHYAELYNTYFRHQSLSYVEESREKFSMVAGN